MIGEEVYDTEVEHPKATNGGEVDWSELEPRSVIQRPRLQVRMPPAVKEELQPLFVPRTRKGYVPILEIAETLSATEALALLAVEPPCEKGRYAAVSFTPTTKLLNRAASLHLSPHVLVRAAAVKLARKMRRERLAAQKRG